MYWPMGAAQIYSANRRRRKACKSHEGQEEDNIGEQEEEEQEQEEDNQPIQGLRTSRNGHLIATITATTMTIWQASVRNQKLSFGYF